MEEMGRLREENLLLRQSANSFADLAERLAEVLHARAGIGSNPRSAALDSADEAGNRVDSSARRQR
jgi:hypothetical protein